jgi:type VI secretion system secreted protein VgrG
MANETTTVRGEIDLDGEGFRLLSCALTEALADVPRAVCEITPLDIGHTGTVPDPATVIGKSAKIKLARADGTQSREIAGLVIEASRFADAEGRPFARLLIAPRLWKLGKRADSRTFQSKSTPEILKEVLKGGGATDIEDKLTGSYPKRVYCVQYRETDLDFVLRLASEEGIYLAVKFADGKDTVVLGDDPHGLGDIEGATTLPFLNTFGFTGSSSDHVMWVRHAHAVKSDKVMLRDYDFERPKLKLDSTAESKDDGPHAAEVYVFPGRYTDPGVGKRYAQVLLDSMQAERDVVSGETTVLTLAPGFRFSIADHPYDPINQEYLVTSVETDMHEERAEAHGQRGTGSNYRCRFTAVPTARTNYRPPRRERARAIPGAQTAVTTGPAGQEVHTDKHGRVKAKYMWDRLGKDDDTSSLWMRTSQVALGGSMLLPRVGWEVSVRHVEGDPDTPVVFTRLYNAVKPPPYALPAGKARGAVQTATTPGGGSSNEFRMDDSKGKEEMMFNASKDMTVDVVNNTTEDIGNNESRQIGANQKVNITNSYSETVGSNQTWSVGGNQTVHVETFMVGQTGADHTLKIGGNRDMKIGGDHKREVGGSSTVKVGSNQIDLVVGSVTDTTSSNMSHEVGTAMVELTTSNKSAIVGGNRTETTGLAKAVISIGGRGVEVGGSMTEKVAGAILDKIGGDRADNAGATFTEIAAGARIIKADSVVLEGDALVSLVMGASTITLTPASISLAGISIKVDAASNDLAVLILDN